MMDDNKTTETAFLPGTNFSKKGNLVSGFCKQDNPVESKDGEALPDDEEKRKLELLQD